jgi:diphthamide biosynthesis protein 7
VQEFPIIIDSLNCGWIKKKKIFFFLYISELIGYNFPTMTTSRNENETVLDKDNDQNETVNETVLDKDDDQNETVLDKDDDQNETVLDKDDDQNETILDKDNDENETILDKDDGENETVLDKDNDQNETVLDKEDDQNETVRENSKKDDLCFKKEIENRIVELMEFDTIYSADSIEFCPINDFNEFYIISTYQLKNQKRFGRFYLMNDLMVQQQSETSAILDTKWSFNCINDLPVICIATETNVMIYSLQENELVELCKYDNNDGILALSCDWQYNHNIVSSMSNGTIRYYKTTPTALLLDNEWKAHEYEAWTASFDHHNQNIIYTGGDDCLFKIYDTRCKQAQIKKNHQAGVCSISKHRINEHMLVTGSYDENIYLWDTRQMKNPTSINTGGGVWRLKWSPHDSNLLLAACMYNGFNIYDVNNTLHCVYNYKRHSSIAYGCDWSFKTKGLIGTCSFYDHLFTLWKFT